MMCSGSLASNSVWSLASECPFDAVGRGTIFNGTDDRCSAEIRNGSHTHEREESYIEKELGCGIMDEARVMNWKAHILLTDAICLLQEMHCILIDMSHVVSGLGRRKGRPSQWKETQLSSYEE